MIEGIIFDFDGLILDTETPEFDAWQEFYAEHGVTLGLDAWADCIGQRAGVFDPIAHLEALCGRSVCGDALRAKHRERFHELVLAESLRPGVTQYLDDAEALGIPVAVASSATRDWVGGHLERLGIFERFRAVHTVEEVHHAKPQPDLFCLALKTLGVSAERAVVFEDSPNGVLAAKRAGVFAVAVPNRVTAPLQWGHADLVVHSLAELSFAQLQERFRRYRIEEA